MAADSPNDASISMFSKLYQYSGKINKLFLIPPNAVIDKQLEKARKIHEKSVDFTFWRLLFATILVFYPIGFD